MKYFSCPGLMEDTTVWDQTNLTACATSRWANTPDKNGAFKRLLGTWKGCKCTKTGQNVSRSFLPIPRSGTWCRAESLYASDLFNSNRTGFVWNQMTPSLRPLHLKQIVKLFKQEVTFSTQFVDYTHTMQKRKSPSCKCHLIYSLEIKCILCVNLRFLV